MKRTVRHKLYSAWDVLWIHWDQFWSTLRTRASLSFQGCAPGPGLRTTGRCHFKARHQDSIRIGRDARLLAGWRSNRVGMTGPVLLTTLGEGQIEIGDHFGASAAVISARSKIRIGNHVNLGGNVRIFDHDFHALDPERRRSGDDMLSAKSAPVEIGDDVFVGAGAMILKGVRLGDRVVVGAGAVVTKSFGPDLIVAGNPAKEVGSLILI